MWEDRYGYGALKPPPPKAVAQVSATRGLVVEHDASGWVGAVIRVQRIGGVRVVELEDRHRKTRSFELGDGFSIDGQP
ncbi:MAG: DUF3097 family protein, partial [Cellulomonadaceae bacterium]|nr:DUF3097 family protein [Cellulomonadaceae bacterium]